MTAIPAHCPYRAGDRVQMHGFPGEHVHQGKSLRDHDVIGFRGTVESYLGATLLTGTTDDGRYWSQEWGGLDPDLTVCHDARCSCCPHANGRCRPDLADADRARRHATAMADWWYRGGPHPRTVRERPPEVIEVGQLALFTA